MISTETLSKYGVLLGIGVAICLAGCGKSTTEEAGAKSENALAGDVRIHGSSTVFPVSQAVAEEFSEVAPKVKVSVGSAGTSGGMKKFVAGEIDILRCLAKNERDGARAVCRGQN